MLSLIKKLKWTAHVKATVARANGTLLLLRRTMSNCPNSSKMKAYRAIVTPILEYGVPAWNPSSKHLSSAIEKVQKSAVRWIDAKWSKTEKKWNKS